MALHQHFAEAGRRAERVRERPLDGARRGGSKTGGEIVLGTGGEERGDAELIGEEAGDAGPARERSPPPGRVSFESASGTSRRMGAIMRQMPATVPFLDLNSQIEPLRDEIDAAIADPAAHLLVYQQQIATRAASGPHRTAVLPPELRPDHVAAARAALTVSDPKHPQLARARALAGKASTLIYQEGCFVCPACGYTKC